MQELGKNFPLDGTGRWMWLVVSCLLSSEEADIGYGSLMCC